MDIESDHGKHAKHDSPSHRENREYHENHEHHRDSGKQEAKVGFIGLGNMGEPMVKNLLAAGFDVAVMPNRRQQPALRLAQRGARVVNTPREVAQDADFVITMLPNLPDVEQVILGEKGVVAGAKPGLILLNMGTLSPSGIQRLAQQLELRDIFVCDAPVSGGPARAQDGTLTIMPGADFEVYQSTRPLLEAIGENIFYTGELGTGQVVKLCNNLAAATLLAISSEVLTMGVKAGVDADTLREVMLKATGANFQLEHWMPKNVLVDRYQPGFALRLMYKDLGLARDLGKEQGAPLFIGNLIYDLYGQFMDSDAKDADFSVISTIYQDAANVTIATGEPRLKSSQKESD